ncbi:MAG: hypothetical protein HYS09_01510 [Chloroflexi bacterium]|nr:hypothetical protein [Chloroflexota bacterium]
METLIIVVIRLLVPLSIFRWPLWGALAALLADMLDIVFITLLPLGGVPQYHRFDKYPDMYYLTIELVVSQRRWSGWPQRICLGLYLWRLVGFALFEITGTREFLFFFPNVFESFFIFMAVWDRFGSTWYTLTRGRLAMWLGGLGALRLVQEYFLHWQRALDDVVAVDVIEDVTRASVAWLADWYGLVAGLLAAALVVAVAIGTVVVRRREVAAAGAEPGRKR